MNKTVTINISGIIFHIEEDAYDKLSKYLITIKGYFSKTDGGNEIMSDIEARVAELLQEKLNVGKQVILMTDVEYVMQVMGKPEDFGGESSHDEKASSQHEQTYTSEEKIKRRLFRNPDEKAIGGVCSGLAAYFDIDTVWVRLAMFLLIFFGGLSLWVYIIMWLIIPEAKTTADRFAMRGESANINNIMRNFKEEAEDVKERLNKYGKEIKNKNYGESVRSNIASVLGTIFNILGRLIGLFILIIGAILLFGYILSIMGISIADSNDELTHWRAVLFQSPADYALAVLSFIIVVGIPVLMMIYGGVKLLFRIRYSNRWLNLGLGLLWTIGFFMGLYVTISTLKNFNQSGRVKQNYELRGVGDTLVIKMKPGITDIKSFDPDNMDEIDSFLNHNKSGYCFPEYDHKNGIMGYADLKISESNNDSIEMIVTYNSKGSDKKDASENARAIRYSFSQDKNVITLDEIFFVPPGNKFRAQEVDVRIRLPKGKVVYLDKTVKYMLDDIENTTNTYDQDMVNRRWIMTDKGLKCIDCNNLESVNDNEDNIKGNGNIEIGTEGIKINDKDAQIKIDEDGIKIKTKKTNASDDETENDNKREKTK